MIRTICVLIIVPALLAGMFLLTDGYVRRVSEELSSITLAAAEDVRAGDWDAARRRADEVKRRWEDTRQTLQIWVNHPDADSVTLAAALLSTSVAEREDYHALLYVDELLEALGHLYHRDNFTLINVL